MDEDAFVVVHPLPQVIAFPHTELLRVLRYKMISLPRPPSVRVETLALELRVACDVFDKRGGVQAERGAMNIVCLEKRASVRGIVSLV